MNDLRAKIRDRLVQTKRSMDWLSKELGKNPSYIQQYIERGSPKELAHELKISIAELLDMPLRELGVAEVLGRNGAAAGYAQPGGFSEDAEHYAPPAGSILTNSETIAYYKMKSDVLELHPLRIVAGDVLAFDISQSAVELIKSEQVVIVQCYDSDPEKLLARTIIREFIRPGLLTTNRAHNNAAFAIDDDTLPFEPHIKGVLRSVVRNG